MSPGQWSRSALDAERRNSARAEVSLKKARVLILCTGNSARSQMAEGILRHEGGDLFEVESAGVRPGSVRPEAIEVMREIGIDMTRHWSKSVELFVGQTFDYIITVCDHAQESCPVFPGHAEQIHQSFEDPPAPGVLSPDETLACFRRVRDQIQHWMRDFITRSR